MSFESRESAGRSGTSSTACLTAGKSSADLVPTGRARGDRPRGTSRKGQRRRHSRRSWPMHGAAPLITCAPAPLSRTRQPSGYGMWSTIVPLRPRLFTTTKHPYASTWIRRLGRCRWRRSRPRPSNVGRRSCSPPASISKAINAGVLIVASSGNEGTATVSYPAAFLQPNWGAGSYGLAVGASNFSGSVARFSNGGSNISLVAPGNYSDAMPCYGVFAAIPTPASEIDNSCYPRFDGSSGARYAYIAGTSFSAPEVAGVAALVWAARPELLNYQVADIIKQSAYRAPGVSWRLDAGWGVLDAGRALELATGRSAADTLTLSSVRAAGVAKSGSRLHVTANVAWQDGVPLDGGTVSCEASIKGMRLSPLMASNVQGAIACAWDIPASVGGHPLTGSVTVTDATSGLTTTKPFEIAVADVTPPKVAALLSSGRWGRRVQLKFVPIEETNAIAASVTVYRAHNLIWRGAKPMRAIRSGRTYSTRWPGQAAKTTLPFRFCVTVKDASRNASVRSCNSIRLR